MSCSLRTLNIKLIKAQTTETWSKPLMGIFFMMFFSISPLLITSKPLIIFKPYPARSLFHLKPNLAFMFCLLSRRAISTISCFLYDQFILLNKIISFRWTWLPVLGSTPLWSEWGENTLPAPLLCKAKTLSLNTGPEQNLHTSLKQSWVLKPRFSKGWMKNYDYRILLSLLS